MKSRVLAVWSLVAMAFSAGAWACTPGRAESTPPPGHDTSGDASVGDAGALAESGSGDGADAAVSADGGPDCATLVATLLVEPIVPNKPIGLDPTRTVDADGILACATYVEPTTLAAGVLPRQPGYRVATFGTPDDAGVSPLTLGFNVESRLPGTLTLEPGYLGIANWQSPTAQVLYTMEVGYPMLMNGMPFTIPWTNTASADPNNVFVTLDRLYGAIMSTWEATPPTSPSSGDCHSLGTCTVLTDDGAGHSIFAIDSIPLKLTFDLGTNRVDEATIAWSPNAPSCATPAAAVDRMDSWPIGVGPQDEGLAAIGGLVAPWAQQSIPGDTVTQANAREGCGGTSVAAPDPGYAAMQWGPSGEVLLEYHLDSGAGHAIFGRAGYRGQFASGGIVLAVGSAVTRNGAPMPIDWTSIAAATPAVTAISNQWWPHTQGSTDCVAANDCTIVPDDGQGHSTFTLTDLSQQDPTWPTLTFVFPQGSSVVQEVVVTE
jgi:hypothetical protein